MYVNATNTIPKPKGYTKEEDPLTLLVHSSLSIPHYSLLGTSISQDPFTCPPLLLGLLSQMSSTVLCPQVSNWSWFFTYSWYLALGDWQLAWAFTKRRCISMWPSLFTEQHPRANKNSSVKKQSTAYIANSTARRKMNCKILRSAGIWQVRTLVFSPHIKMGNVARQN